MTSSASTGAGRSRRHTTRFLAVGVGVVLLIAGALSYLADSDPDGLEAVTQDGCVEVRGELEGRCAAQQVRAHDLAGSPLADYTLGGDAALTGVAGVLGALLTLAVATGLFAVLSRTRGGTRDRR